VEITNRDQFVVASNVTSFIIPGLTASTRTGAGTILEFNSSGNIIPSGGTYNMVSKMDTELSSLQSSVILILQILMLYYLEEHFLLRRAVILFHLT